MLRAGPHSGLTAGRKDVFTEFSPGGDQDERGLPSDFGCCLPIHPPRSGGPDLFPPVFEGGHLSLRRGAVGIPDGIDHGRQGQHDLRAEGRRGPGGLVDDSDEHRGLEVPAWAVGHAGTRDGRTATGGARGGDGARLGPCRGVLCHAAGCGDLPRRAGASAADAEGGVQLAGVVQRGLRPAGAGGGRTELALGSGDGGRAVRGDGLQESAVLGLLH